MHSFSDFADTELKKITIRVDWCVWKSGNHKSKKPQTGRVQWEWEELVKKHISHQIFCIYSAEETWLQNEKVYKDSSANCPALLSHTFDTFLLHKISSLISLLCTQRCNRPLQRASAFQTHLNQLLLIKKKSNHSSTGNGLLVTWKQTWHNRSMIYTRDLHDPVMSVTAAYLLLRSI